jgi:hypothetical protein
MVEPPLAGLVMYPVRGAANPLTGGTAFAAQIEFTPDGETLLTTGRVTTDHNLEEYSRGTPVRLCRSGRWSARSLVALTTFPCAAAPERMWCSRV